MHYVRFDFSLGSAETHNTIPLKQAFGLSEDPNLSMSERCRIDPGRIQHPVEVTWSGRKADILRGNLGYRRYDFVLNDAAFERLGAAVLAPHQRIPVLCANGGKWGIRVTGDYIPHHWIAWTDPYLLFDDIDWAASTFLARPRRVMADGLRVPDEPVVTSFGSRAAYEAAVRDPVSTRIEEVQDLVWANAERAALDLFVLPLAGGADAYVSARLAAELERRPKLKGFKITATPAP